MPVHSSLTAQSKVYPAEPMHEVSDTDVFECCSKYFTIQDPVPRSCPLCNRESLPWTIMDRTTQKSMHKLAGNMPASSSLAQWSKLHPAQPVHEKQSHQPFPFCTNTMNTVLYNSRFKRPHSSSICIVPSSP